MPRFARIGVVPAWVGLAAAILLLGVSPAWADDVQKIAVQLKEVRTNLPVVGAMIQVSPGAAGQQSIVATSDENGVATVEMTPGDTPRLSARVTGAGWVPMSFTWQRQAVAHKVPDHFEIMMDSATLIRGIVVDQDGKPLVGASVMFRIAKKYADHPNQQVSIRPTAIRSDDEGKWTFYGVPAEFDSISLGASHRECLDEAGSIGMVAFIDKAGLRTGTAQLKLERGTPVDIEVRGPDKQPVMDATVGYGSDRIGSDALPAMPVNESGKLHIGVQPGTTAVLTVKSPQYAPEFKTVSVGKEPLKVTIELKAGQLLTGRVVDRDGNGVPGVRVIIVSWRNSRSMDKSITTDVAGQFLWEGAPADEIKVDLLARGFASTRQMIIQAGKENILTIYRPNLFKGKVVDAATGSPVNTYKVQMGITTEGRDGIYWINNPYQVLLPKTVKAGEFELTLNEYRKVAIRVSADGYMPADSPLFSINGDEVPFTFKLQKAANVEGTLVDSDGKPVVEAKVNLVPPEEYLDVSPKAAFSGGRDQLTATTAASGKFTFPPQKDNYELVTVTDAGWAMVMKDAFEKDLKVVLRKWARIEGTVKNGTKPAPNAKLNVSYRNVGPSEGPRVSVSDSLEADDRGNFVIEKAFSGMVVVSIREEALMGGGPPIGGGSYSPWTPIKPGETVHVQVGGTGRLVMWQLELPPGTTDAGSLRVSSLLQPMVERPIFVPPVEVMEMTTKDRNEWMQRYSQSDEGKKMRTKLSEGNTVSVRPLEGRQGAAYTFRAPDVNAGRYLLTASAMGGASGARGDQSSSQVGWLTREVIVPEMPGGVSDEPLDVGTLIMQPPAKPMEVGDDASSISVELPDGKEITLGEFKGKYLIVNTWMTYGKAYLPDRTVLGALWESYGKSGRVAMLGVCTEEGKASMQTYLAARPMEWPQAYAGFRAASTPARIRLSNQNKSPIWLIGPDGKVASKTIEPGQLKGELDKLLAK